MSTEPGTLNVLAYILGDVLAGDAPLDQANLCWFVSTGRGYELDAGVTMAGPAVPPAVPAVCVVLVGGCTGLTNLRSRLQALAAHADTAGVAVEDPGELAAADYDDHDDDEDAELAAASMQYPGGAGAVRPTHSPAGEVGSHPPPSAAAAAAAPPRRGSLADRLKKSVKWIGKTRAAASVKEVLGRSKRLVGLGGGALLPSERLPQLLDRFALATAAGDDAARAAIVTNMLKCVRATWMCFVLCFIIMKPTSFCLHQVRAPGPKPEKLAAFRDELIATWHTLLGAVDAAASVNRGIVR